MSYKTIFTYTILILFIAGCTNDVIISPKPRSFPRVILPKKEYQKFDESYCNLTFEYPKYATIKQDTDFLGGKAKNDCWFDIIYPSLNGKIHCSYYPIETDTSFEKLVGDAFQLVDEHNIKADYIDSNPIQKPDGTAGFVFDISGSTASPFQFYLTDSTEHFIRGAVYINAQTNRDSLLPIVEFMKVDVIHLLNTFEFE